MIPPAIDPPLLTWRWGGAVAVYPPHLHRHSSSARFSSRWSGLTLEGTIRLFFFLESHGNRPSTISNFDVNTCGAENHEAFPLPCVLYSITDMFALSRLPHPHLRMLKLGESRLYWQCHRAGFPTLGSSSRDLIMA